MLSVSSRSTPEHRIATAKKRGELPSRDLLVSPDHTLLIDDILIQAGALVNGNSIIRETEVAEILTYFHVELDDHAVIFAENTPADGLE
jgi:hypothetical protein